VLGLVVRPADLEHPVGPGRRHPGALTAGLERRADIERPPLGDVGDQARQPAQPGPQLRIGCGRLGQPARDPQTSTTIGMSIGRRR